MRFLAVLQILCILFLSSYSRAAQPHVQVAKFDCCKKAGKADKCPQPKQQQKDDCDSQGCSMLLTCGICGFLAVQPVSIKPATFITLEKPVAIYRLANAAGHFGPGRKPPKV